MAAATHPDRETLRRFILGRLDRAAMARLEGHLRRCPRCVSLAAAVPDDRFVGLLRRCETGARSS